MAPTCNKVVGSTYIWENSWSKWPITQAWLVAIHSGPMVPVLFIQASNNLEKLCLEESIRVSLGASNPSLTSSQTSSVWCYWFHFFIVFTVFFFFFNTISLSLSLLANFFLHGGRRSGYICIFSMADVHGSVVDCQWQIDYHHDRVMGVVHSMTSFMKAVHYLHAFGRRGH